jgi:hypothetical protein
MGVQRIDSARDFTNFIPGVAEGVDNLPITATEAVFDRKKKSLTTGKTLAVKPQLGVNCSANRLAPEPMPSGL